MWQNVQVIDRYCRDNIYGYQKEYMNVVKIINVHKSGTRIRSCIKFEVSMTNISRVIDIII